VGHPKVSAQRHNRDSGLALRQQENGQNPGGQGQLGVVEQRSGLQRPPMMAAMALNQRPCLQLAAGIVAAFRAAEPLGPAQLEQSFPASRFGATFSGNFGNLRPF